MKFYIYQGVGTDGELTKVAEVENKKEYTVTGLTANSTYRFAVSSYNGLRESAKSNVITVKTSAIPVQGITLAIDKTALEVGGTAKVTVTITPANETDGAAVLSSSNTDVATVDSDGNVSAVGAGTADITAKIGEKVSNVISLTVYEALVNVTNLAASNVTPNSLDLSWD
ncbi:Ig-like domain-containing protein [Limosilactobacillus sp. c10Ua_36]|uniref:Ig-like domain-containing protein n=1 Tax=Limosilactobacillus sp. c10Ua_36 TaxID=2775910 RepID=UPI002DD66EB0|nr:Ig-like domain-containing protein [Limosilactobacillus sp. c10Ua_36]MEC4742263.1 Ig-like domain-containing protein [Limosilactobacillus sp. c10Ua_36]